MEGVGKLIMGKLKGALYANLFTKLAALTMKRRLYTMKKELDSSETGGAPIIGISKPVVKAHGSSNAKAFKNAIRQAAEYAKSGATEEIAKAAEAFAARKKTEKLQAAAVNQE